MPVVESRTGAVAWALCGIAPFPVPAHQTGRADWSGSSAIAGFRPHRSHRAALPQWALQDGPEADESSVPCLMEGRLRQWEGGQDRLVGRPAHAAFLASLAEHLPPQPDDAVLEHAQGSIVEDHAVVPVVTLQDLAEPTMLLPHRGCIRCSMSCRTAFNFLTMRLACVFRLTTNRPLLVLPQSCVKPRKSKVSGRRCPAAARRSAANRPNSISWVLPSWSDRPKCDSLSLSSARSCLASASC